MLLTTDSLQIERHGQKMKRWRKIFHANRNKKKEGITILISDNIDFKTKRYIKNAKQVFP